MLQDTTPPMPCARVIAVDDSEDTVMVVRALLAADGHHCRIATCGRDAVSLCQREPFDCMLLDMNLGDTTGLAVAERLAHMPGARPPHIILMSGRPREEFLSALRNGLIDAYMPKPAEMESLLAAVRTALTPRHSLAS